MEYKQLTIIFLVFLFICLPISSATDLTAINNYQTVDDKTIESKENIDDSLGKKYLNQTNETNNPIIILKPDLGEYILENNTTGNNNTNIIIKNYANNDTPNNNTNTTKSTGLEKFMEGMGYAATILGFVGGIAGVVAFVKNFKRLTGYLKYCFVGKRQICINSPLSEETIKLLQKNEVYFSKKSTEKHIIEISPSEGQFQGAVGCVQNGYTRIKRCFTTCWNSFTCPCTRRNRGGYTRAPTDNEIVTKDVEIAEKLLMGRGLTLEQVKVFRACDRSLILNKPFEFDFLSS